jgi:hypothetical protein
MEQLLKYILDSIFPESKISIESNVRDDATVFTIYAPQSEIGRIIGKEGKVINAIKQILKIKAMKESAFVDLEIKEQQ